MQVRGIQKELLSLLLEVGKERHPFEYAGLLRETDGVIDELTLLPGTTSNQRSASLFLDMMPLDVHVAGSVHSHPTGVLHPSDADLSFFPRTGRYHIIVGFPYDEQSWACFRADGTPCSLEVIP
jgi:proteasome lid subunit RPN8/RPN11